MKLWTSFATLLASLAILPCWCETHRERIWIVVTKSPSEFSEIEEYILYKIEESKKIAGKYEDLKTPDDIFRNFYFDGKRQAFQDTLEAMK